MWTGLREIYQLSSMSTNRIQLALCTVVEEARREKKVESLGIKPTQPSPAHSTAQHSTAIAAHAAEDAAAVGLDTRLPLPDSRAGTVRRSSPCKRQAASIGLSTALCILWFICRPIAPSVPPSAGPAQPLSAGSTHVNRRPFNHLDFQPRPIAAHVNRHGPAIWGGDLPLLCTCCM